MRTVLVPDGYGVFIFRTPDDVAEAEAVSAERRERATRRNADQQHSPVQQTP